MSKLTILAALSLLVVAVTVGRPLAQNRWFDVSKFDPEKVDCKSPIDMIDECGLQQGYSHRYPEFAYPQNFTFLMSSCKRQADAIRCLRGNAKCLPPLPKQVLIALANSRSRYNKKICAEKQSESATKLLELNQCVLNHKPSVDKALQAEINSILISEAIVNSKIEPIKERLKYSCCSVARVRQEFLEAASQHCRQHSAVASEIIDSYLHDTIGIVCPGFESQNQDECNKIPKLSMSRTTNAKFFVRPILNVVQTLAP